MSIKILTSLNKKPIRRGEWVFQYQKNRSDYASNGRIETYDLFSPFFWNLTTPSTLACKV
jgi:hypothetical protein